MTEYTYAAAYVKSLESGMMSDRDFEAMLSMSEEEMRVRLAQLGYEGASVPEMLENESEKTMRICIELCDDADLRDVMLAQTDFHNIRAVIKAELAGRNASSLTESPTGVDTEALIRAVRTNNFRSMDGEFAEIGENAYRLYKKTADTREAEAYLDRQQLLYILKKSVGNDFVHGWAELYARLADMREYMQARADGEEKKNGDGILTEVLEKAPAELFKYCDDRLTEYLKSAQLLFFDAGAVFAYLEGKKNEIKNLRLLLYASRTGSREKAAESLRRSYV